MIAYGATVRSFPLLVIGGGLGAGLLNPPGIHAGEGGWGSGPFPRGIRGAGRPRPWSRRPGIRCLMLLGPIDIVPIVDPMESGVVVRKTRYELRRARGKTDNEAPNFGCWIHLGVRVGSCWYSSCNAGNGFGVGVAPKGSVCRNAPSRRPAPPLVQPPPWGHFVFCCVYFHGGVAE